MLASADFNGDGVAEIVVGTGPNGTMSKSSMVLTHAELFSIDPFEAALLVGLRCRWRYQR
ncbi:MAG: FG-GAP repeat protein [Gemmataceae bacterium]